MDTRSKDSIRNTETKVLEILEKMDEIEKTQKEVLKVFRSIKESVVRKYNKKK